MSKTLYRIEKYFYKRLAILAKYFYEPELFQKKLSKASSVYFVCSGNICRSAYAEEKLKLLLSETKKTHVKVFSFGLLTKNNLPANSDAIKISKEKNIDLSKHKTQKYSSDFLSDDAVFFCMEPWQQRKLSSMNGIDPKQVFLLGPYTSKPSAIILDPFEKTDDFFRNCFELIDSSLDKIIKNI